MKLNSKITLTLTLLSLMLGVGAVSAWCAMKIGEISIEAVSQPETNPTKKLAGNQSTASEFKEFVPVDEKAIIKNMKEIIDELDNEKENKEKAAKKEKDIEKEKEKEKKQTT